MMHALRARSVSWVVPIGWAIALTGCLEAGPQAYTGYAEAELIYVASPAGGLLEDLAVVRGQRVPRGAALYALDGAPEAQSKRAAEAQQQRAQSQMADLGKGRRTQEIRALQAQLAQARAALEISSSQLKRNRELVAQGFQSAARLDELQASFDRDSARVKEVQAQLRLATEGARPDQIDAARHERDAVQAQIDQIDWQAAQKQRTAPMAATVFDVLYRRGEWVPGGAPVVALLADGSLKLRFFVPQADLPRLPLGQTVRWSCDGCRGGTAQVRYVSPQAEFTPPVIYSNESRGKLVFMIEAEPQGEGAAELKPGQPVTVRPVEA